MKQKEMSQTSSCKPPLKAEGKTAFYKAIGYEPPKSWAVQNAMEWLRKYLDSNGPSPAYQVLALAHQQAEISEKNLKRAKAEIGCKSEKRGTQWFWLPPQAEANAAAKS
jgi:hypothetical protein